MLGMLIAYDDAGDVIATLDHLVARNPQGQVIGLVDFEGCEAAGDPLTDIWRVSGAVGSGSWPEWLGDGAHAYRAELEPDWSRSRRPRPNHRIRALVHRNSGQRRERAAIEAAIAQRVVAAAGGMPADIRDLVGGPDRPLRPNVGSG